jgi:epoxide hydrolase-like predicted phosphatase
VFLAGGPDSVRGFGARHGVPPAVWDAIRRELFAETGLWSAVERGERPFDHFVARLRELVAGHGVALAVEQARDFMENTGERGRERLRPEIVAATARLRTRVPTALLTNNIREWRESWRSLLDVGALFDVVVDSCEVGMRKPETAIYELTRARLGVPHAGVFFLDDLGVNLKAARALGWQTLRYDDTARVLEVLDAIHRYAPARSARDERRGRE